MDLASPMQPPVSKFIAGWFQRKLHFLTKGFIC